MMGIVATLWGLAAIVCTLADNPSKAVPFAVIAVAYAMLEVSDQIRRSRK